MIDLMIEKDSADSLQLQKSVQNSTDTPSQKYIICMIAGEEYGIELNCIHEIIKVGKITFVPNAPIGVDGVINVRGKIIPVINLRLKFGHCAQVITSKSRVIIVSTGKSEPCGLLVDRADATLSMPHSSIEPIPETDAADDKDKYVVAAGHIDDRLIMIVDLGVLLKRR